MPPGGQAGSASGQVASGLGASLLRGFPPGSATLGGSLGPGLGTVPAARGRASQHVCHSGRVLKTPAARSRQSALPLGPFSWMAGHHPLGAVSSRLSCLAAVGLTARRPGSRPRLPFHCGGNSIYREKASFPPAQWRGASCLAQSTPRGLRLVPMGLRGSGLHLSPLWSHQGWAPGTRHARAGQPGLPTDSSMSATWMDGPDPWARARVRRR